MLDAIEKIGNIANIANISTYLKRSLVPSLVIAASRWRGPRLAAMRIAHRCGLPIRLELYFAFDDPYAAIALPALLDSLRRRPAKNRISVQLYPLVQRGIPGDPAALARRRFALTDARRLALRAAWNLSRTEPLDADDCAFLAAWTAAARHHPAALAFASDALELLWRDSDRPVSQSCFEALYRAHLDRPSPIVDNALQRVLQGNTDRLIAKGHWESPSLRIAGEWYFAHERLAQIDRRLDELCA